MSKIQIKKNCIYYYGNPAGYVKDQNAVVDTMFQKEELKEWLAEKNLSATWTDGVFERLSRGEKLAELNGEIKQLKQLDKTITTVNPQVRDFDQDLVKRLISSIKVHKGMKLEIQFHSGIVVKQEVDYYE